jgi:ABC-type branched-subunit amino acid transport system permease subunit
MRPAFSRFTSQATQSSAISSPSLARRCSSLVTAGIVTVVLILGGTRRLYGPFIGAVVYFVVQDWTAKINPYLWEFIVGGMLIATVLFLEGGLMDLGRVARRLFDRSISKLTNAT